MCSHVSGATTPIGTIASATTLPHAPTRADAHTSSYNPEHDEAPPRRAGPHNTGGADYSLTASCGSTRSRYSRTGPNSPYGT